MIIQIKLIFQFKLRDVEKILLKGNFLNINTFIKIILFLYESPLNWQHLKIIDFRENNINLNKDKKIAKLNEQEINTIKTLYRDNNNKIANIIVELQKDDNKKLVKDILNEIIG